MDLPPYADATCCPVVELRQYTLHPGQRDVLIELFDREFVETQEAAGMKVIGQFRDLDRPDRFVWLRGFRDMPSRAKALADFYGGPAWQAHRNAANATMIDSDDVLLLKPALPGAGFPTPAAPRPGVAAPAAPGGLIAATIYHLRAPVDPEFLAFFVDELKPALAAHGVPVLAAFSTEYAANTFPALPVREGEHTFVWFARHADAAALDRARGPAFDALTRRLARPLEMLRLAPTARSALR
jgi:hypothetical protein